MNINKISVPGQISPEIKRQNISVSSQGENRECKNTGASAEASVYRANFAPQIEINGKLSGIKNAYRIGKDGDIPIKAHGSSFMVDKESGSSITYGKQAVKFLKNTTFFRDDTQVIFPKGAKGSITLVDGKKINLGENSAIMLNAGTSAKVEVNDDSAYPLVVSEKNDYAWYERFGSNAQTAPVKGKYDEMALINAHLFNGAFSTDYFVPDSLKSKSIWNTGDNGIGKEIWQAKGKLLSVLNENKEKLSDEQKEDLKKVNDLVGKLHKNNIVEEEDDGYIKFRFNFNEPYQSEFLKEHGLSEDEVDKLMPMCELMKIAKANGAGARRDKAEAYPEGSVQKLKDAGLIFDAKKDDGFIYWKEPGNNTKLLEQQLIEAGFPKPERAGIIKAYEAERKSGYDFTGHKYSDSDIAIYKLDEKLNNWSLEETNHITNATAPSSADGKTQAIGISIVQYGKKGVSDMSMIRKGEQLHRHPNQPDKKQSEVYFITKGSAALGVTQNGKLTTKVLNAGDLAVIEPGVEHFVTSVKGEYEHIVAQVPSTFHYGFGFKECINDVQPSVLEEQRLEAHEQLGEPVIRRTHGGEIPNSGFGDEVLPAVAEDL